MSYPEKLRRRAALLLSVMLVLGAGLAGSVHIALAADLETAKRCGGQPAGSGLGEDGDRSGHGSETRVPSTKFDGGTPAAPAETASVPSQGASGVCLAGSFTQVAHRLASDQKMIWTSPFDLHAQDKNGILLAGVGMVGLVAADHHIMRQFGSTPMPHSNAFSNYGLAAMLASSAGLYLRGSRMGLTSVEGAHSRETGFLAGEAATDSMIVTEALKLAFGRARPNAPNAGSFAAGGASFPSEHAAAAWSVATVLADEYPGRLTKLLAYGTATGIGLARVGAREHFPSDVVVGSAVGYLIGRYVYRAHHNPELPGANPGSFNDDLERDREPQAPPRALRPSELASPFVPLDSWIYAAFDRLAALGYAASAFSNLRPWTRLECARILQAAGDELGVGGLGVGELGVDAGLDGASAELAYPLYQALAAEFADDLRRRDGSGNSEIRIDSFYTRYLGIAGTPLDDGYHFGQTLINDFGRLYGEGSNLVSGGSAWGTAGPLAFYARGEYQHAAALPAYSQTVQQMIGMIDVTPPQDPVHTSTIDQFRLLDGYVAGNFKTIQISAGRQSLWWGPGAGGPPNLSDNVEPLDMLRLTNPSPWRLPSFLHWLGPLRWDFFVAVMGGHHYPPDPGIDGQKFSFKPTPNLEFGFSRTIVFRPVTMHMFLRGFFSFGDNNTTTPGSPGDVGDRRSGFDFSYRIPGLRNWLVVYNDGLTDDEVSPLAYPQKSLMNPGLYLPQIPHLPQLDFRAEAAWSDPPALAHKHGQYFYYNGAYHDAYTNDGHLLGSWVGREGRGLQLWSTYWFSPRNSLQTGYRKAQVDRDFIPAGGNLQDFFVRAIFRPRPDLEITSFFQYERWNFPVLAPLAGPDTVASVEITCHPVWSRMLKYH